VLFVKRENLWSYLGTENPSTQWNIDSIRWTIAFDGKNVGRLSFKEPNPRSSYANDWYYHRDKKFSIPAEEKFPKIRNKTNAFAGWCSASDYRPLVLVSKNNYQDPDKWKSFSAEPSYKDKLLPYLRVSIGRLNSLICTPSKGRQQQVPIPYVYGPKDLEIYRSYRSSNGKVLISIGLNTKANTCDGVVGSEWANHWFLVSNSEVDFLGSGMDLVDAGDYDGDGKTELLFWHSGYNDDGYILVYNDLRQKVEYKWGYH